MTRVRGFRILAAPCYGQRYAFPRYVSMNFMAFEYWTDGWREGSLMPNDEGLRRCKCGRFLLIKDMVEVDTAEVSDLPHMDHVADAALGECIAKADSAELEIAARLSLWRSLNHPYRERYRQHRDAEEAATKGAWVAANPDCRTWWDKLRRRKAPSYSRPVGSPFTYPAFNPTDEQLQNMQRLSEMLEDWRKGSPKVDLLELADLYREQERFEQAQSVIQALDDQWCGVTSQLISRLIQERQTAPMRYRM